MRKLISLGFGITVALMVCSMTFLPRPDKPNAVSKVIIVDGFSNHDWKQTSAVIKWLLEGTGSFEVDVATIPLDSGAWALWNSDLEPYVVVIQETNNVHKP